MEENQIDPLKEVFKALSRVEPPAHLRAQIIDKLHARARLEWAWILKPALVMASFLLVAFLGTVTSMRFASNLISPANKSSILRWTQTTSQYESFRLLPKKEV